MLLLSRSVALRDDSVYSFWVKVVDWGGKKVILVLAHLHLTHTHLKYVVLLNYISVGDPRHTHTYTHTHAHAHAHTHTHTHTRTHTYTHTHTYTVEAIFIIPWG